MNLESENQFKGKDEQPSAEKQRFDRKSAAGYLGVSVVTIDRAVARKRISHYRIGRRIIFDLRHLEEFLNSNERKSNKR